MVDHLRLRPPREEDVSRLTILLRDPEMSSEFGWFGWGDPHRLRRSWDENGMMGPDGGTLIVEAHGEWLGMVNWRKQPTTPASHNWEIGIALAPEARGRGYGTEAQRLLVRYLFAHTTVHRIFAATETDNLAEQKALEKAGFTREGVQRGVGWRDGAWRDGVIYSVLRTDPPV